MTPTPVLGAPGSVLRSPAGARATVVVAGHHGEILQGVFEAADGSVRRGLVTLRCPLFTSRASFAAGSDGRPAANGPRVTVRPATKRKARRAAELALAYLGHAIGGRLTLETTSFEGWGLGSSTADVTAAILAVARSVGARIAAADVARLAVRAEGAADSLMFEGDAVLFAHREGWVLERFGTPLPPLVVVGLNPAPQGRGVDTLALRPAPYPPGDVIVFEGLRARLRRAIATRDAGALGEVATASAVINQRYLPMPHFDTLLGIARASGAVGLQVAHSGCVAGLLFDAASPRCAEATRHAERELDRTVPGRLRWRFHTAMPRHRSSLARED